MLPRGTINTIKIAAGAHFGVKFVHPSRALRAGGKRRPVFYQSTGNCCFFSLSAIKSCFYSIFQDFLHFLATSVATLPPPGCESRRDSIIIRREKRGRPQAISTAHLSTIQQHQFPQHQDEVDSCCLQFNQTSNDINDFTSRAVDLKSTNSIDSFNQQIQHQINSNHEL